MKSRWKCPVCGVELSFGEGCKSDDHNCRKRDCDYEYEDYQKIIQQDFGKKKKEKEVQCKTSYCS